MTGAANRLLAGLQGGRRATVVELLLGAQPGEFELGDDASHFVSRVFGALRISIHQGVAEMLAGGVGVALDDHNPSRHSPVPHVSRVWTIRRKCVTAWRLSVYGDEVLVVALLVCSASFAARCDRRLRVTPQDY